VTETTTKKYNNLKFKNNEKDSIFINIDIYKYNKINNLLYENEKLITLSKLENKKP
jgi:hypothetical protein